MILPTNGRVVVIDDDQKEALALVKALSRNNISVKYFDGISFDEMPTTPLKDVRIVFLDMIFGPEVLTLKTKASRAAAILRKVVDTSKRVPYIMFAWTKDKRLIGHVIKYLKDRNSEPIMYLDLEKSECKNDNGDYDVTAIENKLNEKCGEFKSLTAFLSWENMVNDCAGEIYKDFTSFYQIDSKWDSNLRGVIYGLAEAFVGKEKNQDATTTDQERLRNAMFGINSVFIDTLENTVQKDDLVEVGKINSANIANEVKSRINTKMHLLEHYNVAFPQAGNLYIIKKSQKNTVNEIVIKNATPEKKDEILTSKPKLIELDITPRCDYAQNKRYTRLLTGIMLEGKFKSNKYFKNNIELSYRKCPVVNINKKDCYLLFDYRFFKSLSTDELSTKKDKPKYRIRHELVVDIQASFSNHINRFGVTCID
ncbi:MAG: hypothetical protein C0399_06250 [Syntrophus sp. (in: bacteria)]|nr:hypothetical protein [Syntrophus sp. (in: bacteria)]